MRIGGSHPDTDGSRARRNGVLLGGVLVIVALVIAGTRHMGLVGIPRDQPFDSEKWIRGGPAVRGAMSRDLVARRVLVGAGEPDVLRTLGEPSLVYERPGARILVYNIYRREEWLGGNIWLTLGVWIDPESKRVEAVDLKDS
jgi:hypothetical protein